MTNYEQTLTDYYMANRPAICAYIARRIPHVRDAEDLAQDVFVRLWNVRQTICPETIKSLVYTVATNIIFDHLRRYLRKRSFDDYLYYIGESKSDSTQSGIVANDIAETEMKIVLAMPEKRRNVYMMSRYEDMPIDDIAHEMGISKRTAETHLFVGRKEVREQLRMCI